MLLRHYETQGLFTTLSLSNECNGEYILNGGALNIDAVRLIHSFILGIFISCVGQLNVDLWVTSACEV